MALGETYKNKHGNTKFLQNALPFAGIWCFYVKSYSGAGLEKSASGMAVKC
ncbi:hypothetical protein [Anaeromusa sp.]|uniref:hypothetical protein n=1 Tax=Anaeromusa sp. TaxID=1872520 RepID=UPI002B21C7CB|nr:hypothetical protein [Anaeromusa sp.]